MHINITISNGKKSAIYVYYQHIYAPLYLHDMFIMHEQKKNGIIMVVYY